MSFKQLFTPMKIGTLELPNRLIVAPTVTNFAYEDGRLTEKLSAYLEEKAAGEWGLIITEATPVDPGGKGFVKQPGLWADYQIESHAKMVGRVHAAGGRIVNQFYVTGRQTTSMVLGQQPVAPSAIICPSCQELPHELTIEEIKVLVGKHGDGALRAKKAGYDGVEIHGAHGYMIQQFMSSYSNKRADIYGGSFYNRMRFAVEIIKDVREKCGKNFPIIFRMGGDEQVAGGYGIDEAKAAAVLFEEAGVDALHVTAGCYYSVWAMLPPNSIRRGWITDYAEQVKSAVSIPVITVGRINDPFLADTIISSGKADFVAMARQSLADPFLPKKAKEGRFAEIRHCIGCQQGCTGNLFKNLPFECVVNPRVGKEDIPIAAAPVKKKVFVIGGGPAGMQTAITAAERGHDVHLFEKSSKLGGNILLAAVPPRKGEWTQLPSWQINEVNRLNVKVNLNTEFTAAMAVAQKPDVVIVATGSKPTRPNNIKGIDKEKVIFANDVLAGKVDVAKNVLVIGAGLVGAETAAHLGMHSKNVTMTTRKSEIDTDMPPDIRNFLLEDISKHHVAIRYNTQVMEIADDGVIVSKDGKEEKITGIDTVVISGPYVSVNELSTQIEGIPVITIGDAQEVRTALQATSEGYLTGRDL